MTFQPLKPRVEIVPAAPDPAARQRALAAIRQLMADADQWAAQQHASRTEETAPREAA